MLHICHRDTECFTEGKTELLCIIYNNLRLQSLTCPSFPQLTARYTLPDSITFSISWLLYAQSNLCNLKQCAEFQVQYLGIF
jgi:hypothetical protein